MNSNIANFCQTYDEAMTASRDPKRREKQVYYQSLIVVTRKSIEQMVSTLMVLIRQGVYDVDVSVSVTELVYFNAWFNLRGGWSG